MMAKYTKFCSAEVLIKNIQAEEKDEQCMHILLSVFKKPLAWLEEQYDRQGFLDSIPLLEVRNGQIDDNLSWLYIIQGTAWYHEMPFLMSQFMKFSNFEPGHLKLQPNGVYAILTNKSMSIVKGKDHERQKQKIVKFIKSNIFYPCYLEDQLAKQFSGLIRVKHLRYNKCLNWKDDDGSLKLGIVYKGIVGIQYDWKRRVQLAETTRGMFLTNHYIRDDLQEIEQYSLDPLEDIQSKKEEFPKFRFVSRSQQTILLIFNSRLISQPPFNINPEIKHNIKKQFQAYVQKLNSVIGQEGGLLYRNKKSIKQQLKRRKDKETINVQISKQMMKDSSKRLSPMLMMYTTVNVPSSSLQKVNSEIFKIPNPPKQYSHSIFTTLSPRKLNRSRTQTIQRSAGIPPPTNIVHNTWLQEVSKKHKQTKSFSTLRNLSTYHSERHKEHQTIQTQIQNHKEAKFFVPEQFVKRKLKLKYENLISKIKNFDLRIEDKVQQGLTQKMKRLEQYIDSKRIVKFNTVKTKHRLLRDRVNY